jgi:O-antigen/teichoic acid export membrane protein
MLLKQSATYAVASLVTAIAGVAGVAIFTRLLSPEEYGIYAIATAKAVTVSALLFTWLRQATLRFQSEGADVDMWRTGLIGYAGSALLVPFAILLFPSAGGASVAVLAATIIFTLAYALFDFGQETLRARQAVAQFVRASIVRSTLAVALGVAAVWMFGGGLHLIISAAAAFLIAGLYQVLRVNAGSHGPVDKEVLRKMIAYGAPLTIAGFASALHGTLDRFALGYFHGSGAAGQFSAIADFTRQCMILPVAGLFSAIVPAAVQTYAKGDAGATRWQLAYSGELLAAGIFPCAAGLMIVSPHLAELVFGPEFRATAVAIMPIIALAWIANLMSQQYVHMSFQLATKPNVLIAQCVGLVLFGFCLIVPAAKTYGIVGAAIALAVSEFCGLLLGIYLTRYGHPLPAFPAGLMRVLAATAIMAAVTLGVRALLPWPTGLLPLIVLGAVGAASYALAAVALDVVEIRGTLRRVFKLTP